jgi:GH15 family glucan-1,4-alpha-glucosidase
LYRLRPGYGSDTLNASVLMMPLVGFLPRTDPRIFDTVAAIQRDLMDEGLVRYPINIDGVDGVPPCEGAFLPCTFWLADKSHTRPLQASFERFALV